MNVRYRHSFTNFLDFQNILNDTSCPTFNELEDYTYHISIPKNKLVKLFYFYNISINL